MQTFQVFGQRKFHPLIHITIVCMFHLQFALQKEEVFFFCFQFFCVCVKIDKRKSFNVFFFDGFIVACYSNASNTIKWKMNFLTLDDDNEHTMQEMKNNIQKLGNCQQRMTANKSTPQKVTNQIWVVFAWMGKKKNTWKQTNKHTERARESHEQIKCCVMRLNEKHSHHVCVIVEVSRSFVASHQKQRRFLFDSFSIIKFQRFKTYSFVTHQSM